jgi:hypothetical protein
MSQRFLGLIFIVGGVAVAIISLLADTIGLGSGKNEIGSMQILGMVVGLVIAIIGVAVLLWKKKATLPPAQPETPPTQPGGEPPA